MSSGVTGPRALSPPGSCVYCWKVSCAFNVLLVASGTCNRIVFIHLFTN